MDIKDNRAPSQTRPLSTLRPGEVFKLPSHQTNTLWMRGQTDFKGIAGALVPGAVLVVNVFSGLVTGLAGDHAVEVVEAHVEITG